MLRHRNSLAPGIGGVITLLLGLFASSGNAEEITPPLPPPRPGSASAPLPLPDGQDRPPEPPQAPTKADADTPDEGCTGRLRRLGVRFETHAPVQENSCLVQDPVLVSSLPGDVALAPPALMTCPAVESLARWMQDVVLPEAETTLKSKPTKLLIGTSYQCRDQRSGNKLSEHAFGNALDIMGIEFTQHPPLALKFQVDGSPEAVFQAAIRKAACPIFTTVLGPGADADHGNHFHLDMRKRKADYRICE